MIAANGVTARFLQLQGRASLRRILRVPKRWDRIVQLANDVGEKLPEVPNAVALNAFLTRRRESNPANFADLSLAVIKCLGPGEYVMERPGQTPEGHFGLAVRDYTHSTAPNRRYPDLLTQRLLKAVLSGSAASLWRYRAGDARVALHIAGGKREESRATNRKVCRCHAARLSNRHALRGRGDQRLGKGYVGANREPGRRRARSQGFSRIRRGRSCARAASACRCRPRVHRFRGGKMTAMPEREPKSQMAYLDEGFLGSDIARPYASSPSTWSPSMPFGGSKSRTRSFFSALLAFTTRGPWVGITKRRERCPD